MKKIVSTVFAVAAIVCAVVVLVMLTKPAIEIGSTVEYTLSDMAFGCSDAAGEKLFQISLLNCLPFILNCAAVASLICHIVSLFVKPKEGGRKISSTFAIIFIIICFVAAGVLFFYVVSFVMPAVPNNLSQAQQETYIKTMREYLKAHSELGSGAITAAVFCFIGAAMTVASKIAQAVIKD